MSWCSGSDQSERLAEVRRVTTGEGDGLSDSLAWLLATHPGDVLQLLARLGLGDHGWLCGIDGSNKRSNRNGWVRPTAMPV